MLNYNYTYALEQLIRECFGRMSPIDNGEKTLLFLSAEEELCRLAGSTFDAEAKKMDVVWKAAAKVLPGSQAIECEPATLSDVQKADLVVAVQRPGSKASLKSIFPAWSGNAEVWDLPSSNDDASSIYQNIAKIMVKLILKGGKRQPTPETTVSARDIGRSSAASPQPPKTETVRVQRTSKGRGGKTVTLITGLNLEDAPLQDLARGLKQICGTGGTIKDGNIEIQGDQCDRILAELLKRGLKAKRSGG